MRNLNAGWLGTIAFVIVIFVFWRVAEIVFELSVEYHFGKYELYFFQLFADFRNTDLFKSASTACVKESWPRLMLLGLIGQIFAAGVAFYTSFRWSEARRSMTDPQSWLLTALFALILGNFMREVFISGYYSGEIYCIDGEILTILSRFHYVFWPITLGYVGGFFLASFVRRPIEFSDQVKG